MPINWVAIGPVPMKRTLDLPDHLVRQAKQRALQQGRTLRELVSESIRQGLHDGTTLSVPAASDPVMVDSAGPPPCRPACLM